MEEEGGRDSAAAWRAFKDQCLAKLDDEISKRENMIIMWIPQDWKEREE